MRPAKAGGSALKFCSSHARRERIELAGGESTQVGQETLKHIAGLYDVEAQLRGLSPDLSRAGRQAQSGPLVEALFAWLSEELVRLPGGSPTAGLWSGPQFERTVGASVRA